MLLQGKLIAGILRDILEEIKQLRLEMRSHFQTAPDDPPDPGPRPLTRLAVTMPDGTTIPDDTAASTFVEVIDKLGRRDVKNLNLKVNGKDLMSTSEDDQQRRKLGGFYINVGTSTERKKRLLEDIASRLKADLKVEIIPK